MTLEGLTVQPGVQGQGEYTGPVAFRAATEKY